MKKPIKQTLCMLLAVFMCLSMAACAGGTNNDGAGTSASPSAGESSAAPGEAKHVKNLIVGTSDQPATTSILSQTGSLGKFNYNSITYANLFYPDENNDMQPYFLKSYSISQDGKELEMTFPTTAVWHDGVPVTADDMVFTFQYMRDVMKSKALRNLSDIKVNGKDSITLVFSQPDAYFFVKNATLTVFVLPKHIWENVTDYAAYTGEDAAIGCGPYKLVKVDKDAGTMSFEAVPENAYLGELTVDSITLKSYSSQDSLLMALANGEIDVIYDYAAPISYTLLDVIANNKNIDSGESGYTGCNQVTFGMSKGPNTDHAFREAAVKSLDWKLLSQLSNGSYGEIPGSGILPSACPGYDASLWKMYQDTDEANKILDNAGYKDTDGDGFREMPDGTKFTYKVAAQYAQKKQELLNRIGEVLVSGLKNIGINAYFDQAALSSDEANKSMVTNNDYDMFIGYTTTGVATYRTAFWYFLNREVAGSGGMDWGNSYNNEELNKAYQSLMAAVNNDGYLKAVGDLQKLASKDLFGFAVSWEKCFFPYRTDKYQGFKNYPSIGVVHAETFYTITAK
ncbi:peptide/nickel transport system substrate-binding protein [Sporobacter termitidis DSM 10068]|uniref:Peptide/nickel transport system substrate-binding protein n=1 Tax=Sporobacter termitidis DSM 10068 TaxID=1123282 RepID=A0A1M5WN77_9FIRM|nr:ABC transporter substrate-binding protein [Sporobacter termitidis]SHH88564.1 peptide/nickel transport system substrate-binding protein [Sporobacter termitidis DSM 10068]